MSVNSRADQSLLDSKTPFYTSSWDSQKEIKERVRFLKYVIEEQDGYRLFYIDGKPVRKESDLQIMFKLTWRASLFDMNAEVNNGRGPADFIVSNGSFDKTVAEFKLASNTKLDNLLNPKNGQTQDQVYSKSSRATKSPIKVILYFTEPEQAKVQRLLRKYNLENDDNIIVIDGMPNVSGSKI